MSIGTPWCSIRGRHGGEFAVIKRDAEMIYV